DCAARPPERARRARDHRREPRLPRARPPQGARALARKRLARHRHPRIAPRGRELRRRRRETAGPEDRLPRGGRLPARVDLGRGAPRARRAARQERLRHLPARDRADVVMNVTPTTLPGVLLVTPRAFSDARGYFLETWQAARYQTAGLPATFVQDNLSRSVRGTVRGLHYQLGTPQAKLVSVV